nr:Tim44/TimA family putative adaptor protein [Pseudovibrio hongkongensis]
MNEIFDIGNIIILAIAVIVFLKLRSVLGQRTGHERPPNEVTERFSKREQQPQKQTSDGDNVVPLPGASETPVQQPAPLEERELLEQGKSAIDRVAGRGTPVAEQLLKVLEVEKTFNAQEFLNGAKAAYEMIVVGFADGDRKVLQNLLSEDVFSGFSTALQERESRKERVETTFIGIDKAEIAGAIVGGGMIEVTVRIKSQVITTTRNVDGVIVEGDPAQVVENNDIWTFSRKIDAADPNWLLIATSSA